METQDLVSNTVPDLARRWEEARLSSLREAGAQDVDSDDKLGTYLSALGEEEYESLLKSVFLKSRNLGVSYQKHFKLVWEILDLRKYLTSMKSPCLTGAWQSRGDQASSLYRQGCDVGKSIGARYCQFWREAIDGLVMGLCETERYARHACISAGDDSCLDVFYVEDMTKLAQAAPNELRWGPLPEAKRKDLGLIQEKFQNMKVDLVFLGVSENRLYYRMESKESLSCGSAGTIMRTHLENLVGEAWQGIELQDASPLAVLGEQG